jgi:hypothetical protein
VTGHWWGQAEPIHISVEPWHDQAIRLGTISNVRFSNIVAESQSGILVHGHADSRISNLLFENVRLKMMNGSLQQAYGGNFDLRAAKDVTKQVFQHDIPAVYCCYADGLRINGLQVAWDDTTPDFFSHALQLEETSDVIINGFEGRQPHEKGDTIVLNRVNGISIRDSKATVGTDTFVACHDVEDARLFTNNDVIGANRVFQPKTPGFTMSGNLLPGNQ